MNRDYIIDALINLGGTLTLFYLFNVAPWVALGVVVFIIALSYIIAQTRQ